ncbi:MAG TPA: T9SS type A sorting domain-containing protein [Bacteroidia bacterium]|jgi:hypothetical protein|nr:T9SS type A sorting domain-containing protein [Bacteroidota bacterium]MBP6657140.1 T9SS type A sorting domain-containing protein [Bacteroidia bacterium]MBK7571667.1 T9SS type A sorting domain-containing protein [Bacteroidota bacterium]MBP9789001.1 T9SS type A sorting domain-containing protein [Bacteroidia bacterium]MBP9923302.1 T9SS type A sorting domain-containing protein [Bacteroidia bacterium]
MKTLISILLVCIGICTKTYSQCSPATVATNGSPATRGMYVDCFDCIIADIENGNPLGLENELFNYCDSRCIKYIALFRLDQGGSCLPGGVIGDPVHEATLSQLILDLKARIPGMTVGAVGSSKNWFYGNFTPNLPVRYFDEKAKCEAPIVFSNDALSRIMNPVPDEMNELTFIASELTKFFGRTAMYNSTDYNGSHAGKIDVFSVEYEYWDQSASSNSQYLNYLSIIQALKSISCKSQYHETIETELKLKNLQSTGCPSCPSAYDQAQAIDKYLDRILLVDYRHVLTDLFTGTSAGSTHCAGLYLLGDKHTGKQSHVWPLFSAEYPTSLGGSSWQTCEPHGISTGCNANDVCNDYLGYYVGDVPGTGYNPMYNVENDYYAVPLASASNTFCTACGCTDWKENNIPGTSNPFHNLVDGFMWFTYTLMKDHSVARIRQLTDSASQENILNEIPELIFNSTTNELSCQGNLLNNQIYIELYSVQGKLISEYKLQRNQKVYLGDLITGVYILRSHFSDKPEEKIIKIAVAR